MNFRMTVVLFAAVAAIGVVLLVLSLTGDGKGDTGALAKELASAGAKPEDIDTLELERPGVGTLLIVRTNKDRNTWQIQKPITAEADAGRVGMVVSALLRAKPTPYKELRADPAAHGLSPPSLKATIKQGDRSSRVNFGNTTIGDKGVVFVTTSSQPERPMAVTRGDVSALFRDGEAGGAEAGSMALWTSDFRVKSIFPGDSRAVGEDVAYLKLELPNKKKDVILTRGPGGGWQFESPAGWGAADSQGDSVPKPNTFTGVTPLVRTLTNVSAASAGDFIDNPGDLAQYGLNPDNPDLIRVAMRTKDGQSATVLIGKAVPPDPKAPAPAAGGGQVYVKVEGQPGVVRATGGDLAGLASVIDNPDPLRDRNIITVQPGRQIDGLDIQLAGQPAPTKLRRAGGEWMLYGGAGGAQEAYSPAVASAVDVLTANRAIKDFAAPAGANFAAPAVTVLAWVEGFGPAADPKAEPKPKGEPVKLEFAAAAGDAIPVRRTLPGGQVATFTIPTVVKVGGGTQAVEVMGALSKSRLDFLDPSLPTFSSEAAAKLTVTGREPQNNYTVGKEKPAAGGPPKEAAWRFAAPDSEKGRTADAEEVRNLLHLLGTTQSVSKFVDESPTPEKLAQYGLAPNPRLKAAVALDGGGERVYEFGNDYTDPTYVYARVGGKPAVFTLPRLVFDKLSKPDLRDRALFRFDPEAVTAIDLTGWGVLKLGEQKLRLEKGKEGGWSATLNGKPAPFAVDPLKVRQFLVALSGARAKRFTGDSLQNQKPEYGLGNEHQLIIFLTFREGPQMSMNIAAPTDGGASYYGYSPYLPQSDPFFTTDAGPLKPFKEGPSGFAK